MISEVRFKSASAEDALILEHQHWNYLRLINYTGNTTIVTVAVIVYPLHILYLFYLCVSSSSVTLYGVLSIAYDPS